MDATLSREGQARQILSEGERVLDEQERPNRSGRREPPLPLPDLAGLVRMELLEAERARSELNRRIEAYLRGL